MNPNLQSLVCCAVAVAAVLLRLSTNARAEIAINEAAISEVVELLVSDRLDEVTTGESLLAAERPIFVAALSKRIRAGDADTKGKAASELGIIISPWIRGKEAGARYHEFTFFRAPRRPAGRVPQLAEAAAIRQTLQVAIVALLDASELEPSRSYRHRNSLNALCETLGEVANDQTLDWAINRLQQISSPALAEPLIALGDSYLGIPAIFRCGALCGNSTRAEVERFQRSQELALSEARTRLNRHWTEVRTMQPEERIAFAIRTWRDYFLPRQRSQSGHYSHDEWLFLEMESLVRLGTPAVELLRAQQAIETELEVKAVWEAVIATITGRENARLVGALFEGGDAQCELACEIVVGATSKDWLHELDELQRRSGFPTGKASKAIAVCHRNEGIPALERGFAWSSGNFHAGYSIKELEARASRGPPRGMRRYSFP